MLIEVDLIKVGPDNLNFTLDDNYNLIYFFTFSADDLVSFFKFPLAFATERNHCYDFFGLPIGDIGYLSEEGSVTLHAHTVIFLEQLIIGLMADNGKMTVRERYNCATSRFVLLQGELSETFTAFIDQQWSHFIEPLVL